MKTLRFGVLLKYALHTSLNESLNECSEHRHLCLERRRARLGGVILLVGAIHLTSDKASLDVWIQGVAFVAIHPPAPDEDIVFVSVHIDFGTMAQTFSST